jgi:hypothetical protein
MRLLWMENQPAGLPVSWQPYFPLMVYRVLYFNLLGSGSSNEFTNFGTL